MIDGVQARIGQVMARMQAIDSRLAALAADAPRATALRANFAPPTGQPALTGGPLAPVDPAIEQIVQQQAAQHGLDPALLKAVIRAESGFNPLAISAQGAQGLMQLMPATAQGLGVTNPFDPEQNIAGGARYLKGQLDRFGGDVSLALAAYNAGPGNVSRYGGIPPFPETQGYVSRVLGYMEGYR